MVGLDSTSKLEVDIDLAARRGRDELAGLIAEVNHLPPEILRGG
jgi:hypothetical protein